MQRRLKGKLARLQTQSPGAPSLNSYAFHRFAVQSCSLTGGLNWLKKGGIIRLKKGVAVLQSSVMRRREMLASGLRFVGFAS